MSQGRIIAEEKTDYLHTLPIFFPPPIVTYLSFPFQLSILLAYEKTKAWYFSNYIQLFSKLNSNPMLLLHFYPDEYLVSHTQYFIDISNINELVYPVSTKTIIKDICNWIDNRYYVVVVLSESELPGTALYGKGINPHPQFIFGYDLLNSSLKLMNFDQYQKFSIIDVKFDQFANAFFSKATSKAMTVYNSCGQVFQAEHQIILYKFRERNSFQYFFDVEKVIELFEDYLYSRNTSFHNKLITPRATEYHSSQWGISVYNNLIKYLSNIENNDIDYRAFHGLWEHKKIMISRVEYLINNNYLRQQNDYVKNYIKLEKETNHIRLLILKYNIKKKSSIIKTVSAILQDMQSEEIEILKKICQDLKKKYNSIY